MAKTNLRNEEVPEGPRFTANLYGHASAEGELLNAYRSGRMHHAWLFTGPKGIGKATLAHRLARFVAANPDPRAPGARLAKSLAVPDDCATSRQIRSGAFPDLVEITAETSQTAAGRSRPMIKVDHIHTGLRGLDSTAGAGGWRVIIVDAADDLNIAAANAILKRLEEPPARTLFILVSHAAGRLLPTIRSRCRRLALTALADDDIGMILGETELAGEGAPIPAEVLALAGGSAGEALRLTREGGAEIAADLMRLVGALPRLDLAAAHKLATRLTAQKADPEFRLFCDFLLDWLAESVRAAATGEGSRFSALEPKGGVALFTGVPLAPWACLWENLAEIYGRTLGLNLDRKQFLLNTFFALEATARGQGSHLP